MRVSEEVLRDAESLYDFHASFCTEARPADLIFAAGSHDLRVPEHASALFLQGLAPWLACSGGFGKITDGLFHEPEAVIFARRCIEAGVPEACIVTETAATNTGENCIFTRKLLAEKGIEVKTGIIVCKPYMAARTLATARKQWSEVQWQVNAPEISFRDYIRADDEAVLEINLLTGDLQRLWVYADKGFQVSVEVPEGIREAYRRLVAAGFDKYVIPV